MPDIDWKDNLIELWNCLIVIKLDKVVIHFSHPFFRYIFREFNYTSLILRIYNTKCILNLLKLISNKSEKKFITTYKYMFHTKIILFVIFFPVPLRFICVSCHYIKIILLKSTEGNFLHNLILVMVIVELSPVAKLPVSETNDWVIPVK